MKFDPEAFRTVLTTYFGAYAFERRASRDEWDITGGALDGVVMTSAFIYDLMQTEERFIDTLSALARQRQKMREAQAEARMLRENRRYSFAPGQIGGIERSTTPFWRGGQDVAGTTIQYRPMTNDERAEMSRERFKRDNAPKKKPEPPSLDVVVPPKRHFS